MSHFAFAILQFFEHGTDSQRKELANQLTGHVLPLSLQMYGCRVIQKVHFKLIFSNNFHSSTHA